MHRREGQRKNKKQNTDWKNGDEPKNTFGDSK